MSLLVLVLMGIGSGLASVALRLDYPDLSLFVAAHSGGCFTTAFYKLEEKVK